MRVLKRDGVSIRAGTDTLLHYKHCSAVSPTSHCLGFNEGPKMNPMGCRTGVINGKHQPASPLPPPGCRVPPPQPW